MCEPTPQKSTWNIFVKTKTFRGQHWLANFFEGKKKMIPLEKHPQVTSLAHLTIHHLHLCDDKEEKKLNPKKNPRLRVPKNPTYWLRSFWRLRFQSVCTRRRPHICAAMPPPPPFSPLNSCPAARLTVTQNLHEFLRKKSALAATLSPTFSSLFSCKCSLQTSSQFWIPTPSICSWLTLVCVRRIFFSFDSGAQR